MRIERKEGKEEGRGLWGRISRRKKKGRREIEIERKKKERRRVRREEGRRKKVNGENRKCK